VFGLVLAGWSVLVPLYHAPDEPNHTDAVMRLAEGKGWPHPGEVTVTLGGIGAIASSPYGSRELPYDLNVGTLLAQNATNRADRPSWGELGAHQPQDFVARHVEVVRQEQFVQQIVQHPPLYYWVGAAVLRLLPGDVDHLRWDVVIGTLRLLSALMIIPLPFLAYHGARRLTGDENAATVAAVVPLAVPQLTHIGATVNNDNLLVLTGGLATVAIVYVLRGDTSLRTAAYTGTFIGLALFSKSLAIVFVPMVAAAYLLAWQRARRATEAAAKATTPPAATEASETTATATAATETTVTATATATATTAVTRPASPTPGIAAGTAPFLLADAPVPPAPASALRFPWRQLLLGGILAVAFGGWWWIVNVVRYKVFQPETPGFPAGKSLGSWNQYIEYVINGTIVRWWGAIGWFEMNLPRTLVNVASAVVVVLFALGIIRARDRQARTNLMVLLWPTWALFGLMTFQASAHFAETRHVTGIAGRYLFAGVVSLAIGVGAGAGALTRRRAENGGEQPAGRRSPARWTPLLFIVAAVAMQAYAVSLTMRHFWQPAGGGLVEAWHAMSAWSPWSPTTLATIWWLAVAATGATLVAFIVHGARHPQANP
jgi:small subunit ribosomal protein S36